jgi:hypothetical protein
MWRKEYSKMSALSSPAEAASPTLFNRVVRTYIGGLSLTLEGARSIVLEPQLLVQRGASSERYLEARADAIWHTIVSMPAEMLAMVRGLVRNPLTRMQQGVHASTGVAEAELERQVEAALARMGIPTRERIQRLAQEIDLLTLRIDGELERLADESLTTYAL